ncbi:maltose permease [Fusarium napiforme]|uniref:Maltose permease n=1 Tax=Fusarium napiforme TaxID=42672 RepID=A0A8H5JLN1_9HYPO|nr:maltose permease [Fusarium napiforme]
METSNTTAKADLELQAKVSGTEFIDAKSHGIGHALSDSTTCCEEECHDERVLSADIVADPRAHETAEETANGADAVEGCLTIGGEDGFAVLDVSKGLKAPPNNGGMLFKALIEGQLMLSLTICLDSNVAFLMSKLIIGLGLGFFLTLAPLATSEFSPVVFRGIATAGVNLGIAVGQLVSNGVIKAFGERTDHWAWRGALATQGVFIVILAVGLPFAPETPWYLVRKGKIEEAKKSLIQLYGTGVDIDAKLATIKETIAEEQAASAEQASWIQCFKGTDLIRTMISMGVFICQHFVGIIFVLGYSTYFFQLAGLETSRSFDLGVGVTACGVLGNICSWFVVNSFGRRKIFLSGMGALTILLFLIGIMDVVPTSAAKWVQAACTVIYA